MVECKHCHQITMFESNGPCAKRVGKRCEYALYALIQHGNGVVHVVDREQSHDCVCTRQAAYFEGEVTLGVYTLDVYFSSREEWVTCAECARRMRERYPTAQPPLTGTPCH